MRLASSRLSLCPIIRWTSTRVQKLLNMFLSLFVVVLLSLKYTIWYAKMCWFGQKCCSVKAKNEVTTIYWRCVITVTSRGDPWFFFFFSSKLKETLQTRKRKTAEHQDECLQSLWSQIKSEQKHSSTRNITSAQRPRKLNKIHKRSKPQLLFSRFQ